MRLDDLVEHYPQLFHMAEANTWTSIRTRGLLSTSALLDAFEINADDRYKIESCRRPECVTISHQKLGAAVIREQKPMSDAALRKCLRNMTPGQWYETLNRKVFFSAEPQATPRSAVRSPVQEPEALACSRSTHPAWSRGTLPHYSLPHQLRMHGAEAPAAAPTRFFRSSPTRSMLG